MRTPLLLACVAAWLLSLCPALSQAAANSPFASLSLDEALEKAKAEGKQVMLVFSTDWHGQCKRMDAKTWSDPEVQGLLTKRVVAVKVDPEKEPALAQHFSVSSYPSIHFLSETGKSVKALTGFMEPASFLKEMGVRAATPKAATSPKKKGRPISARTFTEMSTQAWVLSQQGDHSKALELLLEAFDRRDARDPQFDTSRFSMHFRRIKDVAAFVPAAKAEMLRMRDEARESMMASPKNLCDCSAFTAINMAMPDEASTLSAFSALPPRDPRRAIMGKQLFRILMKNRAYQDAYEVKPDSEFNPIFDHMEKGARGELEKPSTPESRLGTAIFAIQRIELLAGLGRKEDARKLASRVLAIDSSALTRRRLTEVLERAGFALKLE